MLSEKSYDKDYVKACRAKFKATLDEFAKLKEAGAFEHGFLAHMILALDRYFVNRMRGAEGKDGNPLNEVRMLCNAIERHDGVMAPDSTIKYAANRAVLGIEIGAPIKFRREDVVRLADAFFNEIEARYP